MEPDCRTENKRKEKEDKRRTAYRCSLAWCSRLYCASASAWRSLNLCSVSSSASVVTSTINDLSITNNFDPQLVRSALATISPLNARQRDRVLQLHVRSTCRRASCLGASFTALQSSSKVQGPRSASRSEPQLGIVAARRLLTASVGRTLHWATTTLEYTFAFCIRMLFCSDSLLHLCSVPGIVHRRGRITVRHGHKLPPLVLVDRLVSCGDSMTTLGLVRLQLAEPHR